MESTEGVTIAQAMNYWYNILDSELKDLVRARMLRLPSSNPPTMEFVFLAINSIAFNLAREKVAMAFMDKAPKPAEKGKFSAKTIVPTFSRQGNTVDFKSKPPRERYCFGCGSSAHPMARCWTLHLELKLANAKTLGNAYKGDKGRASKLPKANAKSSTKKVDNKKGENQVDSCFKTIEAQLASTIAALKSKDAPKVEKKETPSYYGAWDESFCGMAEAAYVTTRAQAQKEVPCPGELLVYLIHKLERRGNKLDSQSLLSWRT